MPERTCTIEGCERRYEARGYCRMHYNRLRENGDALRVQRIVGDDVARFHAQVVVVESGCWEWAGHRNSDGYGRFGIAGRNVFVHRWSYEHHIGPVPAGLQLDHLCRNRACCNPAHLEPVTARENILRGEGRGAHLARRTHCYRGHVLPAPNARGHRRCSECARLWEDAHRDRRRR